MSPLQTPARAPSTNVFERMESRVRSYSRSFPVVFDRAHGAVMYDKAGRAYLDFLSGCSTLNYGHNHPALKKALLEYLMRDGLTHSLDMHSAAKEAFLDAFDKVVLRPRDLRFRVQFPGPTGANAVEAALKLARKITGRTNVIAFTNGFHGVTLGALAATANSHHRGGAAVPLTGVTRAPFDGYFGPDADTAAQLETMLSDPSSGVDAPAAIIVETVQGEGGLNVASASWLQAIERVARNHGALFIIDDIQAGCGRTGSFFSFEGMGVSPDIVTMAKSISGMGLPMAIVLMKPELDRWSPGEHNGTFRGNCHAFVTARAAIEAFWSNPDFTVSLERKASILNKHLLAMAESCPAARGVKGRGMMQGLNVGDGATAARVVRAAFERGLIIETSGSHDEVIKVLAPLTISDTALTRGLSILAQALAHATPQASNTAA